MHYAEYHQAFENKDSAKFYGLQAVNKAKSAYINDDLLQAYQLLAEVSPPEEGRQYAMQYIKLKDSLTERDNRYKDQFARIRYESDTLIKENEAKNQLIAQERSRNTIYLLGITLLLTTIGFIVYLFRQRNQNLRRQNKMVQFQASYDTETRISKRLHDELGNDIFQIMLQYQNDPTDTSIPEKLNRSYLKARDISRDNSSFETDATFPKELAGMLQNYAQQDRQLITRGLDKIEWNVLDTNIKIAVYRVLQELMTNMQKHSQASTVVVVFEQHNKKLKIKYADNGVGIPKEELLSKNGLRNAERRISALDGTFNYETEHDKGFKVELSIPVS